MNPQDRAQAQTLIDAESWEEARRYLESLQLPADDIEWLALRADVETGEENLEQAAALYEKILAIRPENRAALYNSSVVLSDLGRHEDALAALEALVTLEGESPDVLNDLSYEYMEAGLAVPALLAAVRAESLSGDEAQRCLGRLNAATALANMGRKPEARARIDEMLKDCTGACGERDAAVELRQSLDPRHPRRKVMG